MLKGADSNRGANSPIFKVTVAKAPIAPVLNRPLGIFLPYLFLQLLDSHINDTSD